MTAESRVRSRGAERLPTAGTGDFTKLLSSGTRRTGGIIASLRAILLKALRGSVLLPAVLAPAFLPLKDPGTCRFQAGRRAVPRRTVGSAVIDRPAHDALEFALLEPLDGPPSSRDGIGERLGTVWRDVLLEVP